MACVSNFGLPLHLGNWDHVGPNSCDLDYIKYAMHMHVDQKHCCNPDPAHLQRLMASGYNGAWSVESHEDKNEYANVEYQLAGLRQVLEPNVYSADRMAVGGLIERTVPGSVDGLKAFMPQEAF